MTEAGGRTHAIGKIGDIFSHRGIATLAKGKDDAALIDATVKALRTAGTATSSSPTTSTSTRSTATPRHLGLRPRLEAFDARLPEIFATLREGDLLILTADHGNDPTWRGADHTRERVPVLGLGPVAKPLGLIGFADVAETLAAHLGIPPGRHGTSRL